MHLVAHFRSIIAKEIRSSEEASPMQSYLIDENPMLI